jgi:hypothetical protein
MLVHDDRLARIAECHAVDSARGTQSLADYMQSAERLIRQELDSVTPCIPLQRRLLQD